MLRLWDHTKRMHFIRFVPVSLGISFITTLLEITAILIYFVILNEVKNLVFVFLRLFVSLRVTIYNYFLNNFYEYFGLFSLK